MTKILLVEDDKNLREIYGTRLYAEGYDIVSAGDGEEALAMAIREKPDLIISDVMMPKISGFDMLDILRTSEDTKSIPVIMMTALSSEDQRARGESLGANRYLVKSQVGIEDVVRTVHEVLQDAPGINPSPSIVPQYSQAQAPHTISVPPRQQPIAAMPAPESNNVAPQPQQFAPPQMQVPPAQAQSAPQPQQLPVAPSQQPAPTVTQAADEGALPRPIAPFSTPRPAGLGDRVIHPLEQTADSRMDNLAADMAAALSATPNQAAAPTQQPMLQQVQQPTQIPVTQLQPTPTAPQYQAPEPAPEHLQLPSVEQFAQPQQSQQPQQPQPQAQQPEAPQTYQQPPQPQAY